MKPSMISSAGTEPAVLDASELASDPELETRFAQSAQRSRWMPPPMVAASAGR